ncbi:MAG TPA: hypothetical protein PKL78_04105 [Anaerolineales bacterium]|nr:hypothetical protein [Anaerolineales bacterium]HNN12716.1 hypothetical protein [Anaerolineales bacterium]HNO30862.1 hypothetical protein [Anaerolineales bacterium]
MLKKRNWMMVLAAMGAAGYFAVQNIALPMKEESASSPPTVEPTTQPTPPPDDNSTGPGSCGYVWARQDVPELTALLKDRVEALKENASARVEAFGEDCIRPDGSRKFLAKETDFYIRLTGVDLSAEEDFGNFMAQVMETVLAAPSELIPGPQPGFVEFWFEQDENAHIVFRVPIREYQDVGGTLTGAELFRYFNHPP